MCQNEIASAGSELDEYGAAMRALTWVFVIAQGLGRIIDVSEERRDAVLLCMKPEVSIVSPVLTQPRSPRTDL
jgi:hypothetical protein